MKKIGLFGWMMILVAAGLAYLLIIGIQDQGLVQILKEIGIAAVIITIAGLFYKFAFND